MEETKTTEQSSNSERVASYVVGRGSRKMIGLLAEITKQQEFREYFKELPIGTKFIILEEVNLPGYDLLGYFLNVPPQKTEGGYWFTGYIDKGSWKLVGELKENIKYLIGEEVNAQST